MTSQGSKKENEPEKIKHDNRDRRFGHISIRFDMYHDTSNDEAFKALFSQFFPYKAEYDMCSDSVIYYGWCPLFDVLPENCKAPHYDVVFKKERHDSGLGSVMVVEVLRRG